MLSDYVIRINIDKNMILIIALGIALGLIITGILLISNPKLIIVKYVDDYNFKPDYAIIDILINIVISLSLIFTGTIILITIIHNIDKYQ